MNTIWHLVSSKIDGVLAQHLYSVDVGLLNVNYLGTIKYNDVMLRIAFKHTTPNVSVFYLIVDECSGFKLIEHWLGGDGMYVNPNAPTQIVFCCTTLFTVVYSYILEVKLRVVWLVKAEGLMTFVVLILTVDLV